MDTAREVVPQDDGFDGGLPSVAVIKMATAAARLRAAREMQGLTIADVAARTRITSRHVEAIDRGDLAALPGRPYVLGFVRSYARVVGLDEAVLVALVRSELDGGAAPPPPRVVHQFDVDDPDKTPSRNVTWLAILLFVAVLLAGGVFWRSYYAPSTDLPSLAQPDAAQVPVAAPAASAAAPVAGPVTFTAREDGIWVKFYDGRGQQLLQKQLARGESYTVPADAVDPKLWTGRPDALTVTVGGQPVAPVSDHRGIVRDVPVSAKALLGRAQPGAAAPAPVVVDTPHKPRQRPHHAADADTTAPVAAAPSVDAAPPPAPVAQPSGAQ